MFKVFWMGFHPAGCCSWFDKETVAFTPSPSVCDCSHDFKTEFRIENNSVCVQNVWVYKLYVCKVVCPLKQLKRLPDHKHQPLQNPIILLELALSKTFRALYYQKEKYSPSVHDEEAYN